MSEEFLRKYQEDGEAVQTIDEAVPLGQELFEETGGKRGFNEKRRRDRGRGQSQEGE